MSKKDFFIGIFLGLITACIGSFLFIILATDYGFIEGIRILIKEGAFNKLVALGEILNLPLFFYLIKKDKLLMSRGIIFQALLATIFTLFL